MPLLVFTLNQPQQLLELGFDLSGFTEIHLIAFRGTGMLPGNPTLFLSFRDQGHLPVYGNMGSRYPLLFSSTSDRNGYLGEKGLNITGNHKFNGSHRLELVVEDALYNPATFDTLELVFYGRETFYSHEAQFTEIDKISFAG